jgi:DNA-directed RNA polymerase specialized sigma24 family protein
MANLSRYSEKEVRGLIEGYAELREAKEVYGEGLSILVKLADLGRAVEKLPPKEYQAVLLHGQMRHTVRDAEQLLEIARATLHDRYESGISWLTRYLNGGIEA